jgi:hypothetical protein
MLAAAERDDQILRHCLRRNKGRAIAMEGGWLTYARLPRSSHISNNLDAVTDIRKTEVTFLMVSEMQLCSFVA